ncbi:MAG: polar amino acid transport system substrate-binding protein [Solirubrobacteraceae bacterium]|nr:polar amino acid transport system substrate-binding protein [Solirubrobacteraceae bacterium]
MRFGIPRRAVVVAIVMTAALGLAACGSSKSSSTSSTASTSTGVAASGGTDAKIAAEVPKAIRSKGALTVAADATYPPNEFIAPDGHTVVGMDADLAKALSAKMGLEAKVVNATFDSIIPGLAARKYDLGMSSFTDT